MRFILSNFAKEKKLLTNMKKIYVLFLALFTILAMPTMTSCGDDPEDTIVPENPQDPKDPQNPQDPQNPTQDEVAQGWPANYDGVMLQGFYWDSYSDSKWAQLTAQANELSQYFSLIWVPNSGKTSDYYHSKRQTMGYDPCFWLDHNTCWGTQTELRQMIQTFKQKGTGIIEDVVINHKNGLSSWVDFPDETVGEYSITWDNVNYTAICRNDECNSNGYRTNGADDTGDNFDGYRDLDHTNSQVQQNVKTYLKYLINELGYAGFRYDMVKGYSAFYTGMYNATALPTFSVGECWDGDKSVVVNWINGTKQKNQIQSAAFDFPLKYIINNTFGGGSWTSLKNAVALATDKNYRRYAVTFVDNHDTFREGTRLKSNVCAANAYILTMPGTPCLFLKHWQSNKGTLKRLIALRRAAGITNESEITMADPWSNGFLLGVTGSKGKLLLALGQADISVINGDVSDYELVLQGKNFKVYAEKSLDLTAFRAITDVDADPEDDSPVEIPAFCTMTQGETCAFFQAPSTWGNIKCWRWDRQYNYTTNSWPGVDCALVGTTTKGAKVWKWTMDVAQRKNQSSTNEGIIFNDGSNQTADLPFQNGGYYTIDGLVATVTP